MQYLEMRKGRVEIIPMIDIMLFLLVFFVMVTIHMIPAQGIPSHLPGSTTAQTLPPPKLMLTRTTMARSNSTASRSCWRN